MAILDIFKGKKEKERFEKKRAVKAEPEPKKETKETPPKVPVSVFIIGSHVTEKATTLGEKNVYVFKVKRDANKVLIGKEIKRLYNVKPVKINIINIPDKKIFMRGKYGTKRGYRKAMVYLKKGDKIAEK